MKILKNAPTLAIRNVDTAENEPSEVRQNLAKFGKFWQTFGKFCETLEGSFSAVSTPLIARVGAFFRIFQNLQDLHSSAPLQTQNFPEFRQNFQEVAKVRKSCKSRKVLKISMCLQN